VVHTQDRVQVDRDGVPDVERPKLGKLIGQVSNQRFLEPSAGVVPTYSVMVIKHRPSENHMANFPSRVRTLPDSAPDANSAYKSERCCSVKFTPVAVS
jgi:hypothetical protein